MKRDGGARRVLKHRPPVSCSLQQLLQRGEREARGCCSPRRVRKADGGRAPGGCGAHTGVSPAEERSWNTSATGARPLPKPLQAETRQTPGFEGEAKIQAAALDASAMPLSKQRRSNALSTPCWKATAPRQGASATDYTVCT